MFRLDRRIRPPKKSLYQLFRLKKWDVVKVLYLPARISPTNIYRFTPPPDVVSRVWIRARAPLKTTYSTSALLRTNPRLFHQVQKLQTVDRRGYKSYRYTGYWDIQLGLVDIQTNSRHGYCTTCSIHWTASRIKPTEANFVCGRIGRPCGETDIVSSVYSIWSFENCGDSKGSNNW